MTPPLLTPKRSFVITLGLLTGIAALTVDLSLPAIPTMVDALPTSLSRGQQIVGVFMAGMAVGQIPSGLISDRVGRLPVLYVGMILFALAAAAAAFAHSIELMLAARFVQGMGAASAIVLSRAIVRDIASGKEAAQLMSLMMMIFTAAPVIAPSIGALLVAQWAWRAPFIAIAVLGLVVLLAIRCFLVETHTPIADQHPVQQLITSFSEFFSHGQSLFGLLLIIVPAIGYMSVIATSAALIVEIYGFSITAYGLIFAGAGFSILAGAFINRLLVPRLGVLRLITIGVTLIGISAAQLLAIAWMDAAPLAWIWSCVCLYMFTIAIIVPNATVLALDPLPKIAGVASSIIGTSQNVFGASGAILAAMIYDGSVRNAVLIMASVGIITVMLLLLRPLLMPGQAMHHPDELARD